MKHGAPRAEISVQVASGSGDLPNERFLCDWVERTLVVLPQERGVREIGLRLVDEDEGRTLNQQYRQRDYATNVLSFPAADDDEFAALDDALALPLGDLVLCAPVVIREAEEQGKPAVAHWAHLVVHGTLHLAGYDHEDAGDALVMEALEVRILTAGGIGNPYRERDSA